MPQFMSSSQRRRDAQKARIRRRLQLEDKHRRSVIQLRRRIEEARKRRQRLYMLVLLVLIALQRSIFSAIRLSYLDWSAPHFQPKPGEWMPDPNQDYSPQPGYDDYCDGYGVDQWQRLMSHRGITLRRKKELKDGWRASPDHGQFPERYQIWGHRPHLGQIMAELSAPYWKEDAFKALRLLAPPDVHEYLDEAYVTDPSDLRQCHAERDADIVQALSVDFH